MLYDKMKIPLGFPPLASLTDEVLVTTFLSVAGISSTTDLVQLLRYALTSEKDGDKKAGAILRKCLTGCGSLVAVYPALGDVPPVGANLVGDIMDGSLYFVEA